MNPVEPDNREDPRSVGPASTMPARGLRDIASPARDVLERVRRGDRDALGAFFDAYFDRIFGIAYRLLGDRTLAEDATQDVCFRIQRGAHRLDPERDPGPWVLTTTLNVCRSFWRSRAHRMDRASRSLEATEDRMWASDGRSPESDRMAAEREHRVRDAVLDLDESLREIVLLHDYQGLDHKMIAALLGLRHEAVRKRYSRALAGLAARLKSVIE